MQASVTQARPLGHLIFFSRWLQAPLYVGLIIAQGVYVFRFIIELWHLVSHATKLSETDIMILVLTLIDIVMIANLLIMVIVGGYETFVSRLKLEDHPDQPEWLSHVNAGVLKVKLATALIGISSIHLLKTFIAVGLPPKGLDDSQQGRPAPIAIVESHAPTVAGASSVVAPAPVLTPTPAPAPPHANTISPIAGITTGLPDRVVLWQVIIHMAFIISAFMLAWTDRITTKTSVELAHK